jgi:hypothetical protein
LRMHLWIAIHLRSRRKQEECALRDGKLEAIQSPERTNF